MKLCYKTIALSGAFLACGWFAGHQQTSAAALVKSNVVKVQVNDQLMSFPDGQPFIDQSDRLQVPLRFVSEQLGYQVEWKSLGSVNGQENQIQVTLTKGSSSVVLKTGEMKAETNGEDMQLQSAPVIVDNRVYVPFHSISELSGVGIDWYGDNRVAVLNEDGKKHAPLWKAPALKLVEAVSVSNVADQLLKTARQYIGTPYVWGGTTPKGFDCSGFVQFVFAKYDVNLPRTQREMYAKSGVKVSQLKPSDLVFFKEQGSTTHVGIYIGNNHFISATNSGITIDSLSSSYWKARYAGAKRVLS